MLPLLGQIRMLQDALLELNSTRPLRPQAPLIMLKLLEVVKVDRMKLHWKCCCANVAAVLVVSCGTYMS